MSKQNALVYETVEELAEEIGLRRTRTYKALKDGIIPSIRFGDRYIIPRAAIAEWLRTAGKQGNGNGDKHHV